MSNNLNKKIQSFYNASTPLWLEVWGEHMHHGYYASENIKSAKNPQILLIEKLLEFGQISSAKNILDAGCGVGGSARYLAQKFDARALGVTLSDIQAKRGNVLTQQSGLSHRVKIEVLDMMKVKAPEASFDLIWSLESAEHIADKQKLLDHFFNLLKPGGKLIMATWCHRNLTTQLNNVELKLLSKICRLYHLPPMVSIEHLKSMAQNAEFQSIKIDDWSDKVAPFWGEVIGSVFQWKSIKGLSKAGWSTIKGAWAMQFMKRGYKMGTLKFGVLTAEKI